MLFQVWEKAVSSEGERGRGAVERNAELVLHHLWRVWAGQIHRQEPILNFKVEINTFLFDHPKCLISLRKRISITVDLLKIESRLLKKVVRHFFSDFVLRNVASFARRIENETFKSCWGWPGDLSWVRMAPKTISTWLRRRKNQN